MGNMKLYRFPSASGYQELKDFFPVGKFTFLDESTIPEFLPDDLTSKFEFSLGFASGSNDNYFACVWGFRRDGDCLDEHPWISIWNRSTESEVGSYFVDHGSWQNRSISVPKELTDDLQYSLSDIRKNILNLPEKEDGDLNAIDETGRLEGFHQAAHRILKMIQKKDQDSTL